jgi:hypothetical protein
MTKQVINVGTADKGNGDPLRTAFIKVNSNFDELYASLAADLTNVGTNIIPDTDNVYDLGSATHKWRSLYVSGNTIYLDNIALSVEGGVLKLNNQEVGESPAWSNITGKPLIPTNLDSLTDVSITSASSGQVLKYDGSNWVNGTDNSGNLDKLIAGGKEVVLIGGSNPFVTFPAVATGENIIIQGAEIASANGTVAITSSGSVVVNTNALTALNTWTFGDDGNLDLPSGFINSNQVTGLNLRSGYDVHIISNHMDADHEWILDSYGDLTIPGGIKSEGAINIDINLSDSTLRRWTFTEGGDLTLPDDGTIQVNYGNLNLFAENYVFIDSTGNGQINIGNDNPNGTPIVLGNKNYGGTVNTYGDLIIQAGVIERFAALADATGTVEHSCLDGHIFYHTSPDANWTANITNLEISQLYSTAITIVIEQGGTGYYPSAVEIEGVSQTINWQGNATPTPSTNRTDVVTFSILLKANGSYVVLGQLTGF